MKYTITARILTLSVLCAVPALAETIEGSVEFHGPAPAVQIHGNRLKGVWVRIVKGAPEQPGSADHTVAVKQTGCMYEPHLAAMQAGNRLTIESADPVLHNVHAFAGGMTLFNRAMPGPGVISFDKGTAVATGKWEGILRLKCDVHGWMTGFVGVSRNPYFAVSGDDGAFRIENVPPGKYSLAAWHEKFGERVIDVSIQPGRNEQVVFHYGQKLTEAKPH